MANVESVPAGKYGKARLESLGIWDAVAPHVVQADNVRAALAFVATGEAPLGIVYQTDANSEPKVRVVGAFPADSHPADPLSGGHDRRRRKTPTREAFFDYLRSARAKPAYEKQGFAFVAAGS